MPVNAADIMRRPCKGEGQKCDTDMAIIFGVGRCPECAALVSVDDETGLIDPHTVLVIGEED